MKTRRSPVTGFSMVSPERITGSSFRRGRRSTLGRDGVDAHIDASAELALGASDEIDPSASTYCGCASRGERCPACAGSGSPHGARPSRTCSSCAVAVIRAPAGDWLPALVSFRSWVPRSSRRRSSACSSRNPAAAKRDRVDHAARAAASDDPGAARVSFSGRAGPFRSTGRHGRCSMHGRSRSRTSSRPDACSRSAGAGSSAYAVDELRLLHGDRAARPRARSTARTRRRRIRWRTTLSRNGSRTPGSRGSGSCSGPASSAASSPAP